MRKVLTGKFVGGPMWESANDKKIDKTGIEVDIAKLQKSESIRTTRLVRIHVEQILNLGNQDHEEDTSEGGGDEWMELLLSDQLVDIILGADKNSIRSSIDFYTGISNEFMYRQVMDATKIIDNEE